MTVTEIIQQALSDGVTVAADGTEQLELIGEEAMVDRWLPIICENKIDILTALIPRGVPEVCRGCTRLETVEILGKHVAGCLYVASGQYALGWKRLPADLKKCLYENNDRKIKYQSASPAEVSAIKTRATAKLESSTVG